MSKAKAGDSTSAPEQVRAAGGIVWRAARSGLRRRVEVALVHRPAYDDWSFPKGKQDGDESDEETALREVHEETGLRCTLGREVGETRYSDSKGRLKVVRYWLMDADDDPGRDETFIPNREVDDLRWLAPEDAARLLTYEHDCALLRRLATGRDLGGRGLGGGRWGGPTRARKGASW